MKTVVLSLLVTLVSISASAQINEIRCLRQVDKKVDLTIQFREKIAKITFNDKETPSVENLTGILEEPQTYSDYISYEVMGLNETMLVSKALFNNESNSGIVMIGTGPASFYNCYKLR